MPELPEVEVIRAGLERVVSGRRVREVEVHHPRAVRRHHAGPTDFIDRLTGGQLISVRRRGKYLWLPLDSGDAVLGHLGMSGQFLVRDAGVADEAHLRVRMRLDDATELRFVDQRTFGGLSISSDGAEMPAEIAHIGRDPLDRGFDEVAFGTALRRRHTGIKRALLSQELISGIGNIYADEALWRARLHYARPTETLRRPEVGRVLGALRDVLAEALDAGGTSFDALYVNVNGESGYFERGLAVYGRGGAPCRRCGTLIRRDAFMNRSSYTCPTCQPRPRRGRW